MRLILMEQVTIVQHVVHHRSCHCHYTKLMLLMAVIMLRTVNVVNNVRSGADTDARRGNSLSPFLGDFICSCSRKRRYGTVSRSCGTADASNSQYRHNDSYIWTCLIHICNSSLATLSTYCSIVCSTVWFTKMSLFGFCITNVLLKEIWQKASQLMLTISQERHWYCLVKWASECLQHCSCSNSYAENNKCRQRTWQSTCLVISEAFTAGLLWL